MANLKAAVAVVGGGWRMVKGGGGEREKRTTKMAFGRSEVTEHLNRAFF